MLFLGCEADPRTEVIVVVDSDLVIPDEIDTIEIAVTAPGGEIKEALASLSSAGELPSTLGLVHNEGSLGPFEVQVTGTRNSEGVVERFATFTFIRGQTLVLAMHLPWSCVGVPSCPQGQTCSEHGCVDVDVGQLPAWTGTPPRLDTTTPDGDADSDVDGDIDADVDSDGDVDADSDLDADEEEECVPSDELCNGLDDDCDDEIDEGFDLETDEANCGLCGHACDFQNGSGDCTDGECAVAACDENFEDCNDIGDDGCEADLRISSAHCGTCGTPCVIDHGTGGCRDGVCVLDGCEPEFEDCNGVSNDGCEADLMTSAEHCSVCDRPCTIFRGTGACVSGECYVLICDDGYGDCNVDPVDGCEIDLNTNHDFCGSCINSCNPSRECCSGVCERPPCP